MDSVIVTRSVSVDEAVAAIRPIVAPKGPKHISPGQRPGLPDTKPANRPEGAQQSGERSPAPVSPLRGLNDSRGSYTQGVALGCHVAAPSGRIESRRISLPRRRGLTLLEVLLALAISSLVLATLAAAMHFNLRVVGRRQQEIEEAQLARALLRRIADDVRGAVLYNPPDTSSLMSLAGAGSPSSGGASGGGQPSGLSTGDASAAAEEAETQSVAPPTIPGLRGEFDWLQVDVSRMPRRDQYDPSLQAATVTGPADHLSDVKTVTYFVETTAAGTTSTIDTATGLMRVELARAVTRWANQSGTLDLSGGTPIAPEVKSIIFSYFDGVVANGWINEWDSDERGALPVAVKIELQFVSTKKPSGTGAAAVESEGRIYSLVVHLPDRREGDVPEDIDTGGEEVQP